MILCNLEYLLYGKLANRLAVSADNLLYHSLIGQYQPLKKASIIRDEESR